MISRETPNLSSPEGLRRFLDRPRKRVGEHCEMCSEPIPKEHSHVVNVQSRNLMCVCRACYLLFTHQGAAQGRYLAVPERYLYDPDFVLTTDQWEDLQIPVNMAFFFMNSEMERMAGFYPSPAGATESLLPLGSWENVITANPGFADASPDVEALLLRRADEKTACYLVPIDACYELVGLVKMHWRGFSGGEVVWNAIDGFFANLEERSRRVKSSAGQ
jgi:hypothetical protein